MTADLQAQPAPAGSLAATFTALPITHLSHVAYLVGTPIAHSSSPKLHDTISQTTSCPYAQILAETTDLSSFITYLRNHPEKPRFIGSGVTMPHKVNVIPYLDGLTPEARAIGAVNTIFLRHGGTKEREGGEVELWGTNTDTIGIRDAFMCNLDEKVLVECRGRPGLIVGGGGTCRAAIYALEEFLGCSKVYILNRDKEEVRAVIEGREAAATGRQTPPILLRHITSPSEIHDLDLEPPSLIISAVPDYPPSSPAEYAVRDTLKAFLDLTPADERGAVLEMCYHPSPDTGITRLAEGCGWKVIGGLEAMVGQGVEQARLWLGAGVVGVEGLREKARDGVFPR